MPIAPIWAFGAIIIWQLTAVLCASLGPTEWRLECLIFGYILATLLVYRLDRRLIKNATRRSWLTSPRSWLFLAFIAGIGFTIVGSELGNVGQKMVAADLPFETPKNQNTSPAVTAILGSLVYPVAFILVVVGVSLRALLTWINPWGAIILTAGLASLGGPTSQIVQLAFIAGLPIWLYTRTGSLALSIVSYLPATSLPLLQLLGLTPNIAGFDAVQKTTVQQPIWFTLIGAIAIVAGLARIVHKLSPPAETK